MNKFKKMALCGTAAALCFSMTACGSSTTEDTVVATVNGKEIYKSDYDNLYNEYLSYFGGGDEAAEYLSSQKSLLLEELVSNEVLFQKAEELGIECTQEELEEAYQTIEEQYGAETVAAMLEASNMTEESYKETMEDQLILGKLQEVMIEGDTEVTDEEIQNYYDENIADYTIGEGANMKHVLVKLSESADEETKVKAEAAVAEIEKDLADGMTFEELYEKYSADDVDADLYVAEDLGYVEYEEPNFDTDFLAGAKEVGEGKVSAPIKSSFGYHFVQVNGISDETVTPLAEVKDSIKETLVQEKEYALYSACLEKWIEEANVVTYEDRI